MFQLTMSLIHDEARHQRYDLDSSVPNIGDEVAGMRAMIAYAQHLSSTYGFSMNDWQATESTSDRTKQAFWAPFPSHHGPASIYIELQQPEPFTSDDYQRVVDLMGLKARFTERPEEAIRHI